MSYLYFKEIGKQKISSKFIIVAILALVVQTLSCDKKADIPEGKVKCPWDFRISTAITVNNLRSVMKQGDTLKFGIVIPFKAFNSITNDSINLSAFNDIWGGILVTKVIHFSEVTIPGVYDVRQRDGFNYFTDLNIFETDNTNHSLLYKFKKNSTNFSVELSCIPRIRGTFMINFLNSGSRDAFCSNSFPHYILNYLNTDFVFLLNDAVGKDVVPNNVVLPTNYYIKVE